MDRGFGGGRSDTPMHHQTSGSSGFSAGSDNGHGHGLDRSFGRASDESFGVDRGMSGDQRMDSEQGRGGDRGFGSDRGFGGGGGGFGNDRGRGRGFGGDRGRGSDRGRGGPGGPQWGRGRSDNAPWKQQMNKPEGEGDNIYQAGPYGRGRGRGGRGGSVGLPPWMSGQQEESQQFSRDQWGQATNPEIKEEPGTGLDFIKQEYNEPDRSGSRPDASSFGGSTGWSSGPIKEEFPSTAVSIKTLQMLMLLVGLLMLCSGAGSTWFLQWTQTNDVKWPLFVHLYAQEM